MGEIELYRILRKQVFLKHLNFFAIDLWVSANNLKEVVVAFDGTVDKETAEDKVNYSLKSGKVIKTAVLSEDGKTVVLTLEDGVTLNNNKTEALSVSDVKAGEKTLSASNFEFKVFDNEIPEVTSVSSLGTKAVKVVFSEPVANVKQSNFTLDGKAFYGKVNVIGNEVTLTPYSSSALTVGEHTLQVEKVQDFAGFTSVTTTHEVTVVEDKDAPTVAEYSATLETLTLTFSEDVDPDTLDEKKVYWKSGDSKKAAYDYEQLAGNKVKYFFKDSNTLPTGTVVVYVEGVKDYSGNQIAADTKLNVTPEIDQTRPVVKKVEAVDGDTIKVTFSKNLDETSAQTKGNYSVTDKDNKVIAVKSATLDSNNKNVVTIELYSNLSTGNNKLTIKNVKDNTKLQNTMLDYSEVIVKGDTTAPKIDSTVANSDQRRVVIGFDEKMDVETLTDYSNYLVKIDGQLRALTANIADIDVLHDGKVVAITFVEKLSGKEVSFTTPSSNTVTQVTELQVLAVKDVAGNLLSDFTSNNNKVNLTSANTALRVLESKLVDSKTVEVKFNAGIVSAPKAAVESIAAVVGGAQSVDSIEFDGSSTIKIKFARAFKSDASNVSFDIDPTDLETLAGKGTGSAITVNAPEDKVAPSIVETDAVKSKGGSDTDTIIVTFDEAIKPAGLALVASDLEININGTILSSAKGEFSVAPVASPNDNTFEIKVLKDGIVAATDVTVTLKDGKYIQDTAGNAANKFTAEVIKEDDEVTEKVAPTVASSKRVNATTVEITFSEKVDETTAEAAAYVLSTTDTGDTETLTSATLLSDGKTVRLVFAGAVIAAADTVVVPVTVTDLAGNPLGSATTVTLD